jgi:hypothetical protein
MPDNFDKLFDPQRLNNLWTAVEEKPVDTSTKEYKAMEVFEQWEKMIYSEFPDHQETTKIFMNMVRELVQKITNPENNPMLSDPSEFTKNKRELKKVLNQAEDLLEALSLSKNLPQ